MSREMSLEKICAFYAVLTLFRIICPAATHDELPQCGVTGVYRTRQTVIQSPNYPDDYSPSTCLDYVVRSPYRCPTKFHIQFLDFRLESSVNCSNDYLAIGLENDSDDMDVLCGRVVGIKKYHTPDGVLRLRFFTDDSPWTTARGFKLLITRLACETDELVRANIDSSSDEDTEVVNSSTSQQQLMPNNMLPQLLGNLSFQDQHVPYPLPPLFGLNYPTIVPSYPSPMLPMKPNGFLIPNSARNQLALEPAFFQQPQMTVSNSEQPCLPTQTQFATSLPQYFLRSNQVGQQQQLPLISDQYTSWRTELSTENPQSRQQINSPFLPGSASEPCCASSFIQKRFYLSSPGFPRTAFTSLLPTHQRDCQFQIEKASQNICRLRVEFKFFDFGQTYSGTGSNQGNIEVAIGTSKDVCTEDFIEIDDERFCGCRTGYVFNSFFGGLGKKMIRMRMGYSGIPSSGFLLDIIQEDCNGLQQQVPTQNLISGQATAGYLGLGQLSLAQQSNGLPNLNGLGQQQSSINFLNGLNGLNGINSLNGPNGLNGINGQNGLNDLNALNGFNGQQQFLTNQLQQQQQPPSIASQQLYPINQQNSQRTNPQSNPFWMLPQQQLPFVLPLPQLRPARSVDTYVTSESTHKPLTVIETNSTRKEFFYFDGDEALARSSDEPDDPDRVANTQPYAALRARCSFDAMDVLRLSVDYNWLVKPTCYSPQGRWFSNLFG